MTRRGRSGPETVEAPGRDEDIGGLSLLTRLALMLVVVLPNLVGAGVVLVLAAWVLPTDVLAADPGALHRNLVFFGPYLAVAVVVGAWWGHRRMRVPALRPDADDAAREKVFRRLRRVVLRGPLRLALVQTVLWALAAVLFVLLNVFSSGRLGFQVGATVVLGGIVTVSITYRLVEVVLRPAVRRVLAVRPPSGNVLPGVLMRTVGGWLFGTAAPTAGVLLAAGGALAFGGYTVDRLAVVVLVLGGVALVFGGAVITLTAMSTAAPVLAVRRALRRVESGDYDVDVPVFDTTELGLLQAGFNTMVAGAARAGAGPGPLRPAGRRGRRPQRDGERARARRGGPRGRGALRRPRRVDHARRDPAAHRGRRAAQPVLRAGHRRRGAPRRLDQQVRGRRGAGGVRGPDGAARRGRIRARRRPGARRAPRRRGVRRPPDRRSGPASGSRRARRWPATSATAAATSTPSSATP